MVDRCPGQGSAGPSWTYLLWDPNPMRPRARGPATVLAVWGLWPCFCVLWSAGHLVARMHSFTACPFIQHHVPLEVPTCQDLRLAEEVSKTFSLSSQEHQDPDM